MKQTWTLLQTTYLTNSATYVVHEYQGHKHLSLPKENASIENISYIGEVCDDDLHVEEDTLTVHGTEVMGVLNLQTFPVCIVCKAKRGNNSSKPGYVSQMWYPTQRHSLCNPEQC